MSVKFPSVIQTWKWILLFRYFCYKQSPDPLLNNYKGVDWVDLPQRPQTPFDAYLFPADIIEWFFCDLFKPVERLTEDVAPAVNQTDSGSLSTV